MNAATGWAPGLVRVNAAVTMTLFLAACGGGGGSGGGNAGNTAKSEFLLTDAGYGRLLNEGATQQVVNPLSTVATDPITGETIAGTLTALHDSVDLNKLVTFGLGADYLPRVVPRNATLVLNFNRPLDPTTVFTDTLDAEDNILVEGSVRLRRQDGRGVPVDLSIVNGGKTIWIIPVTATRIGFPPSPLDFGPDGEARADATGFLRLTLARGDNGIESASGVPLGVREDHLGTKNTPIGINPGNQVLDFIAQDELIPTNETFNGFLPDRSSPRIIREHRYEKVLDFQSGDSATNSTIVDVAATFSVAAQNGQGEWFNRQLLLRPGQGNEEAHRVISQTANSVTIDGTFSTPPQDGDLYVLRRAEFYEPDSNNPIDATIFDPNNPQNGTNSQLVNFVRVFEIDSNAEPVGEPLSLRTAIPAFSELRVRFNESISERSVGQWENFRVSFNPDEGDEKLTRIVMNDAQDEIRIQPVRVNQVNDTIEVVGWGPGLQALRFSIRTVPRVEFLQARMSSGEVKEFVGQGIRGITDLGGRPLAFPVTLFDPDSPAIVYSEQFLADQSLSSFDPPPESLNWQVMVHRFLGRPETGTDGPTGNPGVKFGDQEDMYWPIADVNLQVNGVLAGQPVVFTSKIHDEFFPPPDGQFGPFPVGSSFPLVTPFSASAPPPFEHNGARFQHVYRDVDASPGLSLAGTLLDLFRVSFAPIGGNVTADTYEDISVHAAHSPLRPITAQDGAGAFEPNYGLNVYFDFETYFDDVVNGNLNCIASISVEAPNIFRDSRVDCVPAGTQWKIAQSKLFSPPFDANAYHPFPEFTTSFQYNNGGNPEKHQAQRDEVNDLTGANTWVNKNRLDADWDNRGGDSLLLEYRIRPQDTPISLANGFTFSPGILITQFPYFRSYSLGSRECGALFPDDTANDVRARCATTPDINCPPPNAQYGDNSRYFMVFDYVKTTSRITSPYPRAGKDPEYYTAFTQPPLGQAPPGTEIIFEYRGAKNKKGRVGAEFSQNPADHEGWTNMGFRATFVGNIETFLAPNFEVVAIPFIDREE